MSKQTEQLLQDQLGIGLSQYRILTALEWNPHVQQRAIAENLGQTEASISRQAAILAAKGFVQIKRDSNNQRRHILAPTPLGMQMTEAATAIVRRSLGPDYAELGEDQLQQLINALQALHKVVCKRGNVGACNHLVGI